MFRRVELGTHPDVEVSDYLTRRSFSHTPATLGTLEFRGPHGNRWSLAMLQTYVANQGDAWSYTLKWLDSALRTTKEMLPKPPDGEIGARIPHPVPSSIRQALGDFLARVEQLGTRTAELHLALAGDVSDPAFAPEPFSGDDRRGFTARSIKEARATFALLGNHLARLAEPLAAQAQKVLGLREAAFAQFEALAARVFDVDKIRCHGDYHLGQVLVTADDFVIIDFEGEPARPLAERREKQLALRDVAGMVRSLHYAAYAAAAVAKDQAQSQAELIDDWARAWYAWTSAAYLASYRRAAGNAAFLPRSDEDFSRVLAACLLNKAVFEVRYELNNRPNWVYLPLAALEDLLRGHARRA
jgi:trehalose synthase-fused probable maltokinase